MERGRTQETGTSLITYDNAVDIGVFDGRIMSTTSTTATEKAAPSRAPQKPPPARKRPKGYKLPLIAGIVLLTLGLAGVAYGVYNLVITNFLTGREQAHLGDRFEERKALAAGGQLAEAFDPNAPQPPAAPLPAEEDFDSLDDVPIMVGVGDFELPENIVDHPEWRAENPPEVGEPLGRIVIPQIDVDWAAVHGVGVPELRKGPGHMPRTAVPGQYGNSVISGHRTTYGAPFHRIDELEPGDRFTVETLTGTHTYEVVGSLIVAPTDVWVVQPREGAWLTLTTCHPKYSSRERLIVFAKMVDGPNIDLITARYGTDYELPEPPADS